MLANEALTDEVRQSSRVVDQRMSDIERAIREIQNRYTTPGETTA